MANKTDSKNNVLDTEELIRLHKHLEPKFRSTSPNLGGPSLEVQENSTLRRRTFNVVTRLSSKSNSHASIQLYPVKTENTLISNSRSETTRSDSMDSSEITVRSISFRGLIRSSKEDSEIDKNKEFNAKRKLSIDSKMMLYDKHKDSELPRTIDNNQQSTYFSKLRSSHNDAEEIQILEPIIKRLTKQTGVVIKDRKFGTKTFKSCFVGKELVEWLIDKKYIDTKEEGIFIGKKLITHKLVEPLTSKGFEGDFNYFRFTHITINNIKKKKPKK